MPRQRRSFFEGVPEAELEHVLGDLKERRFPAGSVVIAEGDRPNEIYISRSGTAEVYVADRHGVEHQVGRVSPGGTLGEMSLFTGQPAVGTVRAADDLDVLVMSEDDFERVTARYPQIYRNLGAILSERLARTNRLAVRDTAGRLGVLRDWGTPPELSYALACSVAWHTRAPTLLLWVGAEPPEEVTRLAQRTGDATGPRASVQHVPSLGDVRDYSLAGRIDELFRRYDHILVRATPAETPRLVTAHTLDLADSLGRVPADDGGGRLLCGWVEALRRRPDLDGIVGVPRLGQEDVEALRAGVLPTRTPAGRAIGWMGRDFAGLKVGLALGAGSLRGYAHVGVLDALGRAGLELDYIAGTSVGASVAGLHAAGFSPAASADFLDRCGQTLFRPTLPIKGLLSARGVRKFLQGVIGDERIENLPIPLALVAADIETQQEIVFRRGILWLAVLASISVPGVYPAQRIGGHTVVDGGVLNPVPTSVVAGMGADTVIAVRLSSRAAAAETQAVAVESPGPIPSALAVMLSAIEIMQSRIVSEQTDATTVTITPDFDLLPGAKLRNFSQGRRFIEAGAAAAEAALPRIQAAMPWVRS